MNNNGLFLESCIYLPGDIKENYDQNNGSSCFLRTKEKPRYMKKRKRDCNCTLKVSIDELANLGFTGLK